LFALYGVFGHSSYWAFLYCAQLGNFPTNELTRKTTIETKHKKEKEKEKIKQI